MRADTFLKILAAELLAIAGFLWGDFDGPMRALIVFMVIDYLTGIGAAYKEKRLNSSIGFVGIVRKGVMLLIVAVGNVVDTQVIGGDGSACRSAVIGLYLANEGLSILENADILGIKWPKILRDALEQHKKKEDEDDDDEKRH